MSKNHNAPSEKLAELIDKINTSHEQCLKALRSAVPHARRTGNLLLEAKEVVGQGKWLAWVQENCAFSVSESQRYMRIADKYSELLAKCSDPAKLTMTEALRLLSPARDKAVAGRKVEDKRLPVSSWEEVKERELEAERLRFGDDSPEVQFVQETAAVIARQVLRLANKAEVKDEDQEPVDPVEVALALVRQLKRALKAALVVRVTEDEPAEAKKAKAKPESNGHKPVNRISGNGKAAAAAR